MNKLSYLLLSLIINIFLTQSAIYPCAKVSKTSSIFNIEKETKEINEEIVKLNNQQKIKLFNFLSDLIICLDLEKKLTATKIRIENVAKTGSIEMLMKEIETANNIKDLIQQIHNRFKSFSGELISRIVSIIRTIPPDKENSFLISICKITYDSMSKEDRLKTKEHEEAIKKNESDHQSGIQDEASKFINKHTNLLDILKIGEKKCFINAISKLIFLLDITDLKNALYIYVKINPNLQQQFNDVKQLKIDAILDVEKDLNTLNEIILSNPDTYYLLEDFFDDLTNIGKQYSYKEKRQILLNLYDLLYKHLDLIFTDIRDPNDLKKPVYEQVELPTIIKYRSIDEKAKILFNLYIKPFLDLINQKAGINYKDIIDMAKFILFQIQSIDQNNAMEKLGQSNDKLISYKLNEFFMNAYNLDMEAVKIKNDLVNRLSNNKLLLENDIYINSSLNKLFNSVTYLYYDQERSTLVKLYSLIYNFLRSRNRSSTTNLLSPFELLRINIER